MFKILYNTFSQLVGKFISASTTLLVTILVANKFGTHGFGEYTKILTYVSLFYLISDFGFNAIVVREMTENKEKNHLFQNLVGLRIVLALLLIFTAVALISFFPYNQTLDQGFSPAVKLGIILASLTILTQSMFTSMNVIFQLNLRYDKSVFAASMGSLVTLLMVLLVVSLNLPLLFVILSYVVGGSAMVFLSILLGKPFIEKTTPLFEATHWFYLIRKTLPIGLTLVFNLIYFRLDVFLLSFLRNTSEVGIYGYAYKFFEFPLAIPIFFMNSYYPKMLKDHLEDKEKFKRDLKKVAVFLLIFSLIISIIGIVAAPLISFIIKKQSFELSILPARILLASLPIYFLSSLFMWVLITLKKEKTILAVYFISMLLNGLLNLIFIPAFGYLASAVITGAVEGIILITTFALTKKYLKTS